jgi:hypothetical protein
MGIVLALLSLLLIGLILLDSFETIILPRRVSRPYRFARLFYRTTWTLWRRLAGCLGSPRRQQMFLSLFGPSSLLVLLGTWAGGLIFGFALLHHGLGTILSEPNQPPSFGTYLYLSGTTFFTLGYGDVTPASTLGRALAVIESGVGFGFLALTISYLPVLYQAFSRREVVISMLDARAGSPPSAAQALLRLAHAHTVSAVQPLLAEWERWSAELLESTLSFPVLSFYRSQHDNQSWLAALTTILDICALLMAGVKGVEPYQAQLTFAMARHAAVDLALVFYRPPIPPDPDRLPPARLQQLRETLRAAGLELRDGPSADAKLAELRGMYEPFVNALAGHFLLGLPPVFTEKMVVDNWQTTAWTRRAPGFSNLARVDGDDHFD